MNTQKLPLVADDVRSLSSVKKLQKLLFPYQWNWLADPSPFKIGLWARQTGKDFTCAAEAVFDSLNTPRNHWLIIACGERQARESLQHAKYWAEFCANDSDSPQITSISK